VKVIMEKDYPKAENYFEQVVRTAGEKAAPNEPLVKSLSNLAWLYNKRGNSDKAADIYIWGVPPFLNS
jgi:hypothetical protein